MTQRTSSLQTSFALLLAVIAAGVVVPAQAQDGPPPTPVESPVRGAQDEGSQAAPASTKADKTAAGAEPTQRLDRVEVDGTISDETRRQQSTASKLVIGRDEIERYGDLTAADVLKRLPGVTVGGAPGRGGAIQMRGMGAAYTQILVNGEKMPPGFSLQDLSPSQIERIEIVRAPTAEYGAQAIAGTINIVLREAPPRRISDLSMGLMSQRGIVNPRVTFTRNDKLDDQGSTYNFTVAASSNRRVDDSTSYTSTQDLDDSGESDLTSHSAAHSHGESVNATGRIQLKRGSDTLSIQPFIVFSQSAVATALNQVQTSTLAGPNPYPYDQASTSGSNRAAMGNLRFEWLSHPDDVTRIEVNGSLGHMDLSGLAAREEANDGVFYRTEDDITRGSGTTWNLTSKVSRTLENDHSLVAGLESEGMTHHQTRDCQQTYDPSVAPSSCAFLASVGDDVDASTMRLAGYLQDEWNVGNQWAFYAGLRWEGIHTESKDVQGVVTNTSKVATPLLHALYKLDGKGREQIRASLTRSYRAPSAGELGGSLAISSLYPCGDPTHPCTTNAINSPDYMSNPGLKPEMATGVEVGYEKYLEKGGLLDANLFYRHITDLIRNEVELQAVPYAPVPRWVVEPRNIGGAVAFGLELEAKFRLDEFITGAPGVNVRSNLSLFQSSVQGIPGPNNRLDQQPRYVANVGADYRLHSVPISLGASLNYTPTTQVQQSLQTLALVDQKRILDAYVIWHISPQTNLRMSASNLLPLDYWSGSESLTDTQVVKSTSGGKSYSLFQISLDIKV